MNKCKGSRRQKPAMTSSGSVATALFFPRNGPMKGLSQPSIFKIVSIDKNSAPNINSFGDTKVGMLFKRRQIEQ